ncbi:MAG TPA: hypothetical protein ENN13_02405, partial [Candidatus Altiarchaeales archaeon]|nr:hypothetical protein [Candidatus Altiarchaeales archaeon]
MPDHDDRQQWQMIHEREKERMKKIEDLKQTIEAEKSSEKKSAKSLLRVVIKAGELKASDANQLLEVGADVILKWMNILESKHLILIEGPKTDPTLKPNPEVLEKLEIYKSRKKEKDLKGALTSGIRELQDMKAELVAEHNRALELEEKLKAQQAMAKELESRLAHEEELKEGLSERVKSLEQQVKGGEETEIEELKKQLEREHTERLKIQNLLIKDRQKIANERSALEKQFAEKQKSLKEREKQILEKEKSVEEDEELDILFEDEAVDESLRQTELKLKDIVKRISDEEGLVKSGKQPPIDEVKQIVDEEGEVVRELEGEFKKILKKKTMESLIEDLDVVGEKPLLKTKKKEGVRQEAKKPEKTVFEAEPSEPEKPKSKPEKPAVEEKPSVEKQVLEEKPAEKPSPVVKPQETEPRPETGIEEKLEEKMGGALGNK